MKSKSLTPTRDGPELGSFGQTLIKDERRIATQLLSCTQPYIAKYALNEHICRWMAENDLEGAQLPAPTFLAQAGGSGKGAVSIRSVFPRMMAVGAHARQPSVGANFARRVEESAPSPEGATLYRDCNVQPVSRGTRSDGPQPPWHAIGNTK